MKEHHHYFFAVKLPGDAKQFLYHWIQEHVRTLPFNRWVDREDYHITLAFLGSVDKNSLEKVIKRVENSLKGFPVFELTFGKLGTFGREWVPRIFWADVFSSEPLMHIQKKVYNHCRETGFQLDRKPFRPHITVARKWEGERDFSNDLLKDIRTGDGHPFSFFVKEIALYETHLRETPKYKEYATFSLREK